MVPARRPRIRHFKHGFSGIPPSRLLFATRPPPPFVQESGPRSWRGAPHRSNERARSLPPRRRPHRHSPLSRHPTRPSHKSPAIGPAGVPVLSATVISSYMSCVSSVRASPGPAARIALPLAPQPRKLAPQRCGGGVLTRAHNQVNRHVDRRGVRRNPSQSACPTVAVLR